MRNSYLLDTHVLIWYLIGDKKLGSKTKSIIEDQKNTIIVSYFSIFEITLKTTSGSMSFDVDYIKEIKRLGMDICSASIDDLNYYRILNGRNKDPFDNMLIATAESRAYTLITSDSMILVDAVRKEISLFDASD